MPRDFRQETPSATLRNHANAAGSSPAHAWHSSFDATAFHLRVASFSEHFRSDNAPVNARPRAFAQPKCSTGTTYARFPDKSPPSQPRPRQPFQKRLGRFLWVLVPAFHARRGCGIIGHGRKVCGTHRRRGGRWRSGRRSHRAAVEQLAEDDCERPRPAPPTTRTVLPASDAGLEQRVVQLERSVAGLERRRRAAEELAKYGSRAGGRGPVRRGRRAHRRGRSRVRHRGARCPRSRRPRAPRRAPAAANREGQSHGGRLGQPA